ncbi:CaiB/BaiF CoA transferase family protein [Thermodesulfobacteriota bacterium]
MTAPLEGVRAIEWATLANGPMIGVQLGWMGADVIKVEERGVDDMSRGVATSGGIDMKMRTGINLMHEDANRNKRSMTLDLKKEKGKEILYKMVEQSDVFYTNYYKATAVRLGLDFKTLSQYNPKLVYCTNSGFGSKGPDKKKRCFDPLGQARSGLMSAFGDPDGEPSLIVGYACDILGATMGAYGILAALVARELHGVGQEIDTSILDSGMWLNQSNISAALWRGKNRRKWSPFTTNNPLANHYQCKDGKWLELCEVRSADKFWHEFCQILGIEDIENDPRFADFQSRSKHIKEAVQAIRKVFVTKTREEWMNFFEEKKAGFAYAPLHEFLDVAKDPQVIANDYIIDFDHPVQGPVKLVNFPVQFSETPAGPKSAAPECGQHTEEILLDFGYSWEDITELREQEVI